MNTKLTFGRLALAATVSTALFACGSATDAKDVATSDEQPITGVPTVPEVPHVVARSISGSHLVVAFDRVVTAAELAPSDTTVEVMRRTGTQFAKVQVLASASLAADGKSLTMALNQPLRAGETYVARTKWKRCVTTPLGTTFCQTYPADLGTFAIAHAAPGGVTSTIPGTVGNSLLTTVDSGSASYFTLDDAPAFAPGSGPSTFHIASSYPAHKAANVPRSMDYVTVSFGGGHLDCAHTAHDLNGFTLVSQTTDMNAQQLMYDDPSTTPGAAFYRGTLTCDPIRNEMVFTPPGNLLGGAPYTLTVNALSTEGDTLTEEVQFTTANPGLRVTLSRVENESGSYDTCDSDTYCDVYVISAIGAENATQAGRAPTTGDWSNMRLYPDDSRGALEVSPPVVLFQSDAAVGDTVDLKMWAFDTDKDSVWKTIFADASDIAAAIAPDVAKLDPKAGAIASLAQHGFKGLADVIPHNGDDQLGSIIWGLGRRASRWNTTVGRFEVQLTNGDPARGPINLYLHSEEWPASWMLPGQPPG